MEGCLWTSCTLPDQHHPTQATGPQFLACTCVEAEPTLVSRAGSQDPPGGLQEEDMYGSMEEVQGEHKLWGREAPLPSALT